MLRILTRQVITPTQGWRAFSLSAVQSYSQNSDNGSDLPGISPPLFIQGFQAREHEFAKLKVRNMDRSGEESEVCVTGAVPETSHLTAEEEDVNECYQPISNVSLYSVMQTNVPDPCASSPTHMNMPFGGIKLGDKFTSNSLQDTHPLNVNSVNSKSFSTFSVRMTNKPKSVYSYGVNESNMQGVQGPISWEQVPTVEKLQKLENPCPQGIQGADCDKFKLWLHNCTKHNIPNCDSQLKELQAGRKTLAQVFEEQEKVIEEVSQDYAKQNDAKVGINSNNVSKDQSNPEKLTQRQKLQQAVRQYGTTIILFHVGISLLSLGGFYAAVASGIDMVGMLKSLGVGEKLLESTLVTGAGTFVVAYAVHKVFAPVRISISLSCGPLLVRYLRKIGILKSPKP